MTFLTDSKHLSRRIRSLLACALELEDWWRDLDHDATFPRRNGFTPVSGGGRSDPTETVASGYDRGPAFDDDPSVPSADESKYGERDKLGRDIDALVVRAERLVASRKPVTPDRDCLCCDRETATHGLDDEGRLQYCDRCRAYFKRMGRRCTDEIHDGRGTAVMCECPTTCCEVCPDKAADGRLVSERCKKRMHRDPLRRAG